MINPFRKLKDIPERGLIFIIMAVAVILRILALWKLSLSNDEMSALTRARYDSVSDLITHGIYIDFHPAGVQLFIYFWIKLFGDNPVLYRIPFVLFGLFSIVLIYKLGKRWFSSFTGGMAAASFAVLKFTIIFTLFARPYSPGLFFCLLLTWAWSRIIFPTEEERNRKIPILIWILFLISMSACTHIHYFSFVFGAGVGVTGLLFLRKEIRFTYILSGILVLLLFLPEWNIFYEQIKSGDLSGWLGAPSKGFLFEFFLYVFNDSWFIVTPIIIGSVVGTYVLFTRRRWSKFHTISLSWFLFSFLLAYIYSVLRCPVIQYSTLFFTFPFLLYFIFSAIESAFKPSIKLSFLILLFLVTGAAGTVWGKKFFKKTQYGVFKELVLDLKNWSGIYSAAQVPAVINVVTPEYINYYMRQENVAPLLVIQNVQFHQDLVSLRSCLDTMHTSHFAFAWSNTAHPYEINKLIEEFFPVLEQKKIYFNSAAYLYAREGKSIPSVTWKSVCDYEKNSWDQDTAVRTNEKAFRGLYSERMDTNKGFSRTLVRPVSEIPVGEYRWLTANAWFWTEDPALDASLVIQFDRNKETYGYYAKLFSDFNVHPGQWQQVILSVMIPPDCMGSDVFKIYIANHSKGIFYLDDISAEVDQGDDPYKE